MALVKWCGIHSGFLLWIVFIIVASHECHGITTLIARFMGPTWGPSGADRTQVGPMLAPWTLLSGKSPTNWQHVLFKLTTKISKLCMTGPVRGKHRWSVDSPHKGPVMQKAFTYHYTIMTTGFPSQMACNMEHASIIMIDRFPTQRASNLDSIYIFMTSSCSNFSETCLWSCPSHWPTPSPRSPPLPAAPPAPCPSGARTHR